MLVLREVNINEHKWKVIHEKCDTYVFIRRSGSFLHGNLFYFALLLWNIKLRED